LNGIFAVEKILENTALFCGEKQKNDVEKYWKRKKGLNVRIP
jgi:hypothetical protein